MLQKDASFYLKLHLIGFMIGRFSGSYHEARACRQAAFIVCTFDSDLPLGGSFRLWRGTPLGGGP